MVSISHKVPARSPARSVVVVALLVQAQMLLLGRFLLGLRTLEHHRIHSGGQQHLAVGHVRPGYDYLASGPPSAHRRLTVGLDHNAPFHAVFGSVGGVLGPTRSPQNAPAKLPAKLHHRYHRTVGGLPLPQSTPPHPALPSHSSIIRAQIRSSTPFSIHLSEGYAMHAGIVGENSSSLGRCGSTGSRFASGR